MVALMTAVWGACILWGIASACGLIVVPDAASKVLLADLGNATTHAGKLSGALTVHLYQNNVALGRSMVIGSFTEATFTGYAADTLATPPTAFLDPVLGAYLLWGVVNFTVGSSPTITNTIYGYYVLDTGGALLWAEAFATPILMTAAGNNIAVVPVFGGVSQQG